MPSDYLKLFGSYKGIIGIEAFTKYYLELSFSEKKIKLHDSIPVAYKKSYPINFTLPGRISTVFKADGYDIPFLIDTGYHGSILYPESCIRNDERMKVNILSKNNVSPFDDFYFFKSQKINIFDIELYNKVLTTSTFAKKDTDGIIGMTMLKNFNLLFDFHGQTMYYALISSKQIINNQISNEIYGNGLVDLIFTNDGLIVNQIIENSPAWIAGFRPGTLIKQVGDIKVVDYSYSRLTQIIAGKESIVFKVIIDGSEKEILLNAITIFK
jgi:hypothetical protein